jgi:hypothetical protein
LNLILHFSDVDHPGQNGNHSSASVASSCRWQVIWRRCKADLGQFSRPRALQLSGSRPHRLSDAISSFILSIIACAWVGS